ncbi:germination protein, Ger(x)C family [Paenibacillus sp. 1_12]|uniref:Ger(x)C family spore germination protein n=1 Tax=Paenibacillus sp. 1_12 TaxID=1566278 RepID=UPI0008E32079|nr:Ger(x)C family spore germination protein [Paenibacillus sp. 1_12]SFL22715.1 germination protein, Ger(x)C family [Paenibacillus sp. 1_12]
MAASIKWVLILALLLLESGCWDSKPIQNMVYVTAIGLDYQEGNFIVHVQTLNFINVAKIENFEIGKNVPVWIGIGKGKTVSEALTSIYATSQVKVYWGHVRAIVCGEGIINNQDAFAEAYDAINRYREVRYNILLYGTREPMSKILTQKSIFNLSPLESILDTPEDSYSQRSSIPPQYGYRIIAELNELGQTALLPSLSTDDNSWTEDQKKKAMFKVDGAFMIYDHKLKGWFSEDDLKGAKWLQKRMKRSIIQIPGKGEPIAALVLKLPKQRIEPYLEKGELRFNITINVRAYVDEMVQEASIKKMEQEAEAVVRDQIKSTYLKGVSQQTDLLNLLDDLYKKKYPIWRSLHDDNQLILKEDTLNKIDVHVTLTNTGTYKGKKN